MAAFSPDMLAHRLRLALPRIFVSHAMAFHAVLVGAMALGASVGLVGFATLDALKSESSALTAERTAATSVEPAGGSRVTRETPSLRPAPADAPSLRSSPVARGGNAEQPLTANTLPAIADDIDAPAPARAKRQHYAKKKHQRVHHAKKRKHARRQEREHERGRTPNAKARALARALGS